MFEESKFVEPLGYIKKRRDASEDWDVIDYAGQHNEQGLQNFLDSNHTYNHWEVITCQEWHNLVEYVRHQRNWIYSQNSAWNKYKQLLRSKNYLPSAIDEIERTVNLAMDHLSTDTTQRGAIKGLVVGNVQSGKTGHMAGLMAMAADEGFNMFIVLSGLLDNLREQTEDRLNKDLQSGDNNWTIFRHPGTKTCTINADQLDFTGNRRYFTVCLKNPKRLENLITYLQKYADKQEQMRVLVIEDEADQASINTQETDVAKLATKLVTKLNFATQQDRENACNYFVELVECDDANDAGIICNDLVNTLPLRANADRAQIKDVLFELFMTSLDDATKKNHYRTIDNACIKIPNCNTVKTQMKNLASMRTRINELLGYLVSGRNCKGEITRKANDDVVKFKAMNFVGYTATPYANLLNEPAGELSLFPQDFILSLKHSDEYFGPKQIFGCARGKNDDMPGLGIVRPIIDQEVVHIEELHAGTRNDLPESMKNSIRWFYCCAAYFRHLGICSPVSMMIHTSAYTDPHLTVANLVSAWIYGQQKQEFLTDCETLWNIERARFNKQSLDTNYPGFSGIGNVMDLPPFNTIEPQFANLFPDNSWSRLKELEVDPDGNPQCCDNGVNFCVDNSKIEIRVKYPKVNLPVSPAYIVIGGATLSRGLTFEGLVSSYFPRKINQCDTLMQMGRWFGYRRGYELLPRIWVSNLTRQSFEALTIIEEDLRDEINALLNTQPALAPTQVAMKIKNSPSWIGITAKNKMRHATPASIDFIGKESQTIYFDDDQGILQHNIDHTEQFLEGLMPTPAFSTKNTNCLVWTNVDFTQQILPFLQNFKFWTKYSWIRDNLTYLSQWIANAHNYNNWDVVLYGNQGDHTSQRILDRVGKVSHSKVKYDKYPDTIYIKSLVWSYDILTDVDINSITDQTLRNNIQNNNGNAKDLRSKTNRRDTPLLTLYVIDKDSRGNGNGRLDLNAPVDVIGMHIYIPGSSVNSGRPIEIMIDPQEHNQ